MEQYMSNEKTKFSTRNYASSFYFPGVCPDSNRLFQVLPGDFLFAGENGGVEWRIADITFRTITTRGTIPNLSGCGKK